LIAQNVVERDLRIDFFRGLALYMILVDHVFGDPFSRLTYQNFGFSDAAEIFVFLSGVSCGIVYPRILSRRGWSGLMAAVIKRSAQIYAYYVLSSIAVILLLKAAAGSINNARVSDLSIVTLREESFSAIRSTIFLTSPPDLPGILVLYLILTFFVIPLFLKGAEFTAALTLAASGLVWIVSQIVPNFLPGLADRLAVSVFDRDVRWDQVQFGFAGIAIETSVQMAGAHRLGDCDIQFPVSIFKFLLIQTSPRSRLVPHRRDDTCANERKSIPGSPSPFPKRRSSRHDLCQVKQSYFRMGWFQGRH